MPAGLLTAGIAIEPRLFVPEQPPQLLASGLGDAGAAIGAAVRAALSR